MGVPSQPTQRWPGSLAASPSHTDDVTWRMLEHNYASNYGPQPRLNSGLRAVNYPEPLMYNGVGGPATFISYNSGLESSARVRQFVGRFSRC
jgi:hypothetical protein